MGIIFSVASEQEQIERKRKTLERLRREAQRRGIKLGPGSASEPDIVVEPQPEPKSVTEAKLRAKLQAKKKVILHKVFLNALYRVRARELPKFSLLRGESESSCISITSRSHIESSSDFDGVSGGYNVCFSCFFLFLEGGK